MVLLACLWVPALVILFVVREVLLPFLLALLLAYVMAPVVRRLSAVVIAGRQLPRWAAVIALYAAFGGMLYVGGAVFVPQLYREMVRLAKDATETLNHVDDESIARFGTRIEIFLEAYQLPVRVITPGSDEEHLVDPRAARKISINIVEVTQSFVRDAKTYFKNESSKLFGQLQRVVMAALRFVFQTFLVLMLTAFIAADTERITSFFFSITPISDRTKLSDLLARIDRGLGGVVRGQLTICVINGVLTLVGLLLLKVKFAFLLASIAAVFSLVPVFGSITSTIPIVIVSLSSGPTTAALVLFWIVGIHALEANFLNPKIMGDHAKIHPVLVILALLVGEHWYGIVGALLAVPIMSILVTVFKAARARAMQIDEEVAAQEERAAAAPPTSREPLVRRQRLAGEHADP
jgi:predicted PurR-regulated permease PerM